MSVTAFPVLARISQGTESDGIRLGTISIACAAIDDVSAWVLLAILTAMVRSPTSWRQFASRLAFLAVFILFMFIGVFSCLSVCGAWFLFSSPGIKTAEPESNFSRF